METTLSLQVAREVDSKHVIIIIGAVPAGIAIAACLNLLSTPNIVLEREDCIASLWKKKSYDRLKLHLAKKYCTLPHMTFPSHFPKFVSKYMFIQYLDNYVARFNVNPLCSWSVEWQVVVWNAWSSETQEFEGRFLVVVTDESSEGSKGVGVREFLRESCTFKCEYDNGNRCSGVGSWVCEFLYGECLRSL